MSAVSGGFKDGVALPDELVEGYEGRQVLIAFLDESQDVDDWSSPEDVVK